MKDFIEKHQSQIKGVLSCFDRMLFRGYLPVQTGQGMAAFLWQQNLGLRSLKDFLIESSQMLRAHAEQMAEDAGRPFKYLEKKIPMERRAREIAEHDGIKKGLVCIFRVLQPCRTFSFTFKHGSKYVESARRKCLFLYYYFIDPQFGLMHVKIQTWFPMSIQIYVNGQEWLARKLTANRIGFTKVDNVFVNVEDMKRAQAFADRLSSLNWPMILNRYARRVNPLMDGLLKGQDYYWVTAQSEYATDVLFKNRHALQGLFPRLLSHGMRCFGAKEVMGFLGRKLVGQFQGEVISDVLDFAHIRIPGARIKHRVGKNWLKMYDKGGMALRVEMVINSPEDFRVRRQVRRKGESKTEWVQMRKGVAYLFRYRDISRSVTSRYLDALAVVSDPTTQVLELDKITRRRQTSTWRSAKALNPLSVDEVQLFKAVMNGEHNVRGFANADMRKELASSVHFKGIRGDKRRQSAKVTRIFQRLHIHGLIAKIPRSRRWRTTGFGRRMMATAIQVRELNFPQLLALAA